MNTTEMPNDTTLNLYETLPDLNSVLRDMGSVADAMTTHVVEHDIQDDDAEWSAVKRALVHMDEVRRRIEDMHNEMNSLMAEAVRAYTSVLDESDHYFETGNNKAHREDRVLTA
ncbi:hypothetical protein ACRAWG_30265 [Methylobacterium sp. P31]